MLQEYNVDFIERLQRTPTAVSYRFKRPAGLDFDAGQYMVVDLGDRLAHPLSFSDCPEEDGFIEFTKRMTGSSFCQRLESLQEGDAVTVKGPAGLFCTDQSSRSLVMIAGGIGITPIRSVLKSRLESRRNPRPIILLYGNLNRDDIAFRVELDSMELPDYRVVHVLSDTTGMAGGHAGFITADIITAEVPEPENSFFMVSGPPVMVEAIKKALASIKIPDERICTDLFVGY